VGDRSVKIRLTAEAKSLISELKASASAAEELKTATGSVKRELGDLQNRSDKAGTSLLKLAADGKIAGEGLKAADKQLNDLNRDLAKMGSAQVGGSKGVAGSLTAQIKDAEAELKKLAEEFRNTGSASSLSGFRSAEKELGKLKGLLSEVERIGNSGGGNNSKGFFSNLISSGQGALDQQLAKGFEMSLTNPYVLGAAAAAAVPLGAVIGGAVLTGVGLVGIGGGIAGQIKDPAVVKAAGELAADFKTVFKGATDSFRGPLVGAVHTFDDELHKLGPGLTDTFRGLAGSVDKLAGGAAGFIDELVPGLERAALASRPLISDLSTWLPRLGGELGGIFDVIASHSQEARAGLSILTTTLDVLLNTAKTGITIMSGLFDAAKFSTLGIGFLSAKSDADQTSNAFDDLDESTAALGQTTDQLANAYDPLLAALQKTEFHDPGEVVGHPRPGDVGCGVQLADVRRPGELVGVEVAARCVGCVGEEQEQPGHPQAGRHCGPHRYSRRGRREHSAVRLADSIGISAPTTRRRHMTPTPPRCASNSARPA
jgi:hypothetical protein